VRVDPVHGDRTTIADRTTGHGPTLRAPLGLAIEADGHLVMVDAFDLAVVRVDPHSGDRTVISGCTAVDPAGSGACVGTILGRGRPFAFPRGLAVEADGHLVVVDLFDAAVVRVDPVSGDRTIVADDTIGRGPSLGGAEGIAVERSGQLVVAGGNQQVVRVDPRSGDRTLVSGCIDTFQNCVVPTNIKGSGPLMVSPQALAVEADGHLAVAGVFLMPDQPLPRGPTPVITGIVRIDPSSGDRTLVSACGKSADPTPLECLDPIGGGTPVVSPGGIAVQADGRLLLVDEALQAVVGVEPISGNRRLVSR
jgi:hypothetical protein